MLQDAKNTQNQAKKTKTLKEESHDEKSAKIRIEAIPSCARTIKLLPKNIKTYFQNI